MLKSPKTNTLVHELIERTSSMLDEIESKTMTKKLINRGKRSKTLSEVKPVENKQESAEFSRDKSCAKASSSFT